MLPCDPNSEPDRITAGDTLAWTRSIPGYPASTWTLKYALQLAGADLITLTATASGNDFAVAVAASVTAAWAPGVYTLLAYVEQGSPTARTGIGRSLLSVLPGPLAALGETHAARMLSLIEAALERRIPAGLEMTNIDGQELQRIPIERLSRLQLIYQSKVTAERNAAAIAAGRPNRRTIFTRFTRVR